MQTTVPQNAGPRTIVRYDVSNTDKPSEVSDHQRKGDKPATKKDIVMSCERGEGEVVFQIRCSKLIASDCLEAFHLLTQ